MKSWYFEDGEVILIQRDQISVTNGELSKERNDENGRFQHNNGLTHRINMDIATFPRNPLILCNVPCNDFPQLSWLLLYKYEQQTVIKTEAHPLPAGFVNIQSSYDGKNRLRG